MIGKVKVETAPVVLPQAESKIQNKQLTESEILGKRTSINICQAHSGTKRMRHNHLPNKEELLQTEMKIQDQINQWM